MRRRRRRRSTAGAEAARATFARRRPARNCGGPTTTNFRGRWTPNLANFADGAAARTHRLPRDYKDMMSATRPLTAVRFVLSGRAKLHMIDGKEVRMKR